VCHQRKMRSNLIQISGVKGFSVNPKSNGCRKKLVSIYFEAFGRHAWLRWNEVAGR
jgi:hypothetical protein